MCSRARALSFAFCNSDSAHVSLSLSAAGAASLRSCLLRLELGAMAGRGGASPSMLHPEPEPEPELEPETEIETQKESATEAQLSRFRAVHDDAQRLQQYVAINFIGFVKGMKKFEKKTGLSVAHLFMPRLQRAKFFNSPKLANLLHDLDYHAKLLLCRLGFVQHVHLLSSGAGLSHTESKISALDEAKHSLRRCDLCAEESVQPVALPCTHGLCWPCAASASAVASSDGEWACPVCMRPQLLNPEVYRISSFGQKIRRTHSSGSLAEFEHPLKSDEGVLASNAEPASGAKSDSAAPTTPEKEQDGSVLNLIKGQSYYEELVSLANHPSKPQPLLQFYHARLHGAANDGRERLEYKLPDALACSRKVAVSFALPPASELKRRAILEAFKWRRILLEDEWVMVPSLDEAEATEVAAAASTAGVSSGHEIVCGHVNSPKKQLNARNELSPLLRVPSFEVSDPQLDAGKVGSKSGRCLRAFLWRLLDVAGLSLAVPHLETAEADALNAYLQDRLHDTATHGPGSFRGFKPASEVKDLSEISFGKHLSKGASGTVTEATWQGMSVAVKRFYYCDGAYGTAETRAAFENELFLMRQLQHANLVRFFGAHSRPPDLCIIMELMHGSLTDLLYGKLSRDATKVLTPLRQLGIACGICCGMGVLHAHNVCHRDLKSANVLFDRKLNVKLCDFAFSKFRQVQVEAEGDAAEAKFISSVGTPAWMAPEVLRGDECVVSAQPATQCSCVAAA